MLLTLDISNTSIKAGVFRRDELLTHWRIATGRHKLADDYGMLPLNLLQASGIPASEINGVSMSCVVPPLRSIMRDLIAAEPLAKLDYVSAAHASTLQELVPLPNPPPSQTATTGEGVLLSMAVRVGKPKLIDNFLYENGQWLTGEVARHRRDARA